MLTPVRPGAPQRLQARRGRRGRYILKPALESAGAAVDDQSFHGAFTYDNLLRWRRKNQMVFRYVFSSPSRTGPPGWKRIIARALASGFGWRRRTRACGPCHIRKPSKSRCATDGLTGKRDPKARRLGGRNSLRVRTEASGRRSTARKRWR